jgi:hypothetical protein
MEPFKVTFYPYTYTLNTGYKIWVILQQIDGTIVEVERFTPVSGADGQEYTASVASADERYDVTFAIQIISTGKLLLNTWKNIPSGKKLDSAIFNTQSDNRNWPEEISVSNLPEIDDFQCIGAVEDYIFTLSPPPNFKAQVLSAFTGGTGSLLRYKPKGGTEYAAYWLPIDSIIAANTTSRAIQLDASAFTTDMPKVTLQFPFADNWGGQIRGVTQPDGQADFAYLASFNSKNYADEITAIEAEKPDALAIDHFWVFASYGDTLFSLEYEWLFDPSNTSMTLPDATFSLKKLSLNGNGNIYTESIGEFDVLHLLVFGNAGKISWAVDGSPKDLERCIMPDFPDSLKQQWPQFVNFNLGQSRCGDYKELQDFDEYLEVDQSESLWKARLGFSGVWQHWK